MEKIGILWDLDGTIVNSVKLYFAPYACVFEKYGLGELDCTIDEYLRTSVDGGVSLIPGVDRVIDAFYAKGYPMAIASTSWMPTVVHTLERVGLLGKFANIASGYLLPSKPAPDIFRIAAEMINIPPESCVVFEDSLAGMKGAKSAGMKCVGIATSVPIGQMTDADIRLNAYDDLRIEDVELLFM